MSLQYYFAKSSSTNHYINIMASVNKAEIKIYRGGGREGEDVKEKM